MASTRLTDVITATVEDRWVRDHLSKVNGPDGTAATIEDLKKYMGRLERTERAKLAAALLGYIELRVEPLHDAIDQIYSYIVGDQEVLRLLATTENGVREQYPNTARAAEASRQARDRRGRAQQECARIWGAEVTRALQQYGFFNTENTARLLQTLALRESNWDAAAREINRMMMHRIMHPSKGRSAREWVQAGDIKQAADTKKQHAEYNLAQAGADALRKHYHKDTTLKLWNVGNLPNAQLEGVEFTPTPVHRHAPAPERGATPVAPLGIAGLRRSSTSSGGVGTGAARTPTRAPDSPATGPDPSPLDPYGSRYAFPPPPPPTIGATIGHRPRLSSSLRHELGERPEGAASSSPLSPSPGGSSLTSEAFLASRSSPGASALSRMVLGTPEGSPRASRRSSAELYESTPPRRSSGPSSTGSPEARSPSAGSLERYVREMSESRGSWGSPEASSVFDPGASRITEEGSEYTPTPTATKGKRAIREGEQSPIPANAPAKGCGCNRTRVSDSVKRRIEVGSPVEATQFEILALFQGCLVPGIEATDVTTFCHWHTGRMGAVIGLRVKYLTDAKLIETLHSIHSAGLTALRSRKTNPESAALFRKANRPGIPSDTLGPYRFFVPSSYTRPVRFLSPSMRHTLLAALLGSERRAKQCREEWEERGTVNVNIFKWLVDDPRLKEIVDDEYAMYLHHQREINGNPNLGWLRTMVYGVIQQLCRQYIGYWMAYVALRPDGCCWLISYPYYAKNTVGDDRTSFKHIDLNINRLVGAEQRGAHQIQGSVSFDDESGRDATVLVPGMHKHLKDWRDRLASRPDPRQPGKTLLKDGYVAAITDKMLTKEDLKDYKTDWESVPCNAGDARITMPHLPHGAQGPAQGRRRTMLPWLVALQADHSRLEVVEGGTYEQVRDAHRDMVAPPLTPSGLANKYGKIPYAFPASHQLEGLGAISDALVGRKRWDGMEVQGQLRALTALDGDFDAVGRLLVEWRRPAVDAALRTWAKVKEMERSVFGKKSYFYCKERRLAQPSPDREANHEREGEEVTEMGEDGDPLHLEGPLEHA